MARVLLINPQPGARGWGSGRDPLSLDDLLPHHGLAQIAAVLRGEGHEAGLLDLRLMADWDEARAAIAQAAPEVVGVTAFTQNAGEAARCLGLAAEAAPRALRLAGGIHFTMFPQEALEAGAHKVLRGEAEASLPRLIAAPDSFPEVSWGEPPDLGALPFAERELLPGYRRRQLYPVWSLTPPVVDMLTSRGCPWSCRFCCGPGEKNLYTRPSPHNPDKRIPYLRRRPVEHVMAELAGLWERYRFRGIIFNDDEFFIEADWLRGFCEAMHQAGYPRRKVGWWAACRADMICRRPELIAEMRRAGLKVISIGFESFSDPLLAWLGKGTSAAVNRKAAEICHALGLEIFANLILGVPREDGVWRREDDEAGLRAIREIRPAYFSPSFFSPVPGSPLYAWARESGLMLHQDRAQEGSRRPGRVILKGVDYPELERMLAPVQASYRRFWRPRLQHYLYRWRSRNLAQEEGSVGWSKP
ncbi:MAG: B12-binding domain-containing radical SAM protein [Desulfarculaceae bacterium]|nr:B12-binding domain-containing radical SAM protein [Desulfarculaceae bacterium]